MTANVGVFTLPADFAVQRLLLNGFANQCPGSAVRINILVVESESFAWLERMKRVAWTLVVLVAWRGVCCIA
jgi:hypothetical protein